jgi:hypothetical protein
MAYGHLFTNLRSATCSYYYERYVFRSVSKELVENQQLQKWALIAEIVGGIAVVLSLTFVGLQVRQSASETALNTQALEVSAYQGLVQQISDFNTLIIGDTDLIGLDRKMFSGGSFEDEIEEHKYRSFVRMVFRHADMAHYQYVKGLISEETLLEFLGPAREHLTSLEFSRKVWEEGSRREDFISYVNRMMQEIQPNDLYWQ